MLGRPEGTAVAWDREERNCQGASATMAGMDIDLGVLEVVGGGGIVVQRLASGS